MTARRYRRDLIGHFIARRQHQQQAYTRGNWVNAKGRARGISDREILTGRAAAPPAPGRLSRRTMGTRAA